MFAYEESNRKIAKKYFNKELLFDFDISEYKSSLNSYMNFKLKDNINLIYLLMNVLLIKYIYHRVEKRQKSFKSKVKDIINTSPIFKKIKEFVKQRIIL